MSNTIIIPMGPHSSLILNADPADLTTSPDYDPEDGSVGTRVELLGRWIGSLWPDTTIEGYAGGLYGRYWQSSFSEAEYREMKARVTPEMHKRAVELLRSLYADIVSKLDADIKHNLFRAHHQGVYDSLDRAAVIRYIERWLVGIKYAK